MAFREEDPETLKARVESLRAELEDAQQTIRRMKVGVPERARPGKRLGETAAAASYQVASPLSPSALDAIEGRLRAENVRDSVITRLEDRVSLESPTWKVRVEPHQEGARARADYRMRPFRFGFLVFVPVLAILAFIGLRIPSFILVGLALTVIGAVTSLSTWLSRSDADQTKKRLAFAAIRELMNDDVRGEANERTERETGRSRIHARVEDEQHSEDAQPANAEPPSASEDLQDRRH